MDSGIALVAVGFMAFLGSVVALIGSLAVPWWTSKIRAREREEDLERQDIVAKRVADVASAVVTARAETTATMGEINSQIKQVHTLVNSTLTKAMQGELDQTKTTLILLKQISDLLPREPTPEELATIKSTEGHIAELELVMIDRAAQARIVTAEQWQNKNA